MRRRVLLLLLAGLSASGAVAATATVRGFEPAARAATSVRTELGDFPAPTALAGDRIGTGRAHDTARDDELAVGLAGAVALMLSAGWWTTRARHARARPLSLLAVRNTRAPPVPAVIVHR